MRAPWVPPALSLAISGVSPEVNGLTAAAALLAWGLIPAVMGLLAVHKRDVV